MKRNISLVKGTHDIHGAEMESLNLLLKNFIQYVGISILNLYKLLFWNNKIYSLGP